MPIGKVPQSTTTPKSTVNKPAGEGTGAGNIQQAPSSKEGAKAKRSGVGTGKAAGKSISERPVQWEGAATTHAKTVFKERELATPNFAEKYVHTEGKFDIIKYGQSEAAFMESIANTCREQATDLPANEVLVISFERLIAMETSKAAAPQKTETKSKRPSSFDDTTKLVASTLKMQTPQDRENIDSGIKALQEKKKPKAEWGSSIKQFFSDIWAKAFGKIEAQEGKPKAATTKAKEKPTTPAKKVSTRAVSNQQTAQVQAELQAKLKKRPRSSS